MPGNSTPDALTPSNGGERAATGPHVLRMAPGALGMLGDFSVAVTIAAVAAVQCGARPAVASPRAASMVRSMVTGVRDVQDSSISFLSRSWLARPNSCILRALILLTVPSTAPELYGNVSPAVTASRSRRIPRVNERSAGRS